MSFALTCTCGARLEIDDRFAGQIIHCPDCRQPLHTRKSTLAARRTSGLALTSIVLALVGAFTVLGTILAVVLGAIALFQIARKPDRLSGKGYAMAGIVIGVLMTGGTILALSSIELFGLAGLVGEAVWAGNLDFTGPLEVVRPEEGFSITRPSEHWGVYRPPLSRAIGDLNHSAWDDLLLVLPAEDTVVLCFAVRVSPSDDIAKCGSRVEREFPFMEKIGLFNRTRKNLVRDTKTTTKFTKQPVPRGQAEVMELQMDKRDNGEDRSFLIQVIKSRGDDRMYVVIGGTRRGRFSRSVPQIREAMDSFRLLPRNGRGDW
jgi:hypothetical protein